MDLKYEEMQSQNLEVSTRVGELNNYVRSTENMFAGRDTKINALENVMMA